MKKNILLTIAVLGLILLIWTALRPGPNEHVTLGQIKVTRGDIVRQALAVGHVSVEHEVPVKSVTGGILTKSFVSLGQKVTKGMPLAEVTPVITSRNYVETERSLELAKDGVATAEEYVKGPHLAAVFTRWLNGPQNIERMKRQAELNQRQVEEELELLKQGKTSAEGRMIDFNVLAPVDGHVIELVTREGAPVVSSSSFGSGTILMVLADLDQMLFMGTVDEIDVGRLKIGMKAHIRVGALPGESVMGTVSEIGLKSKLVNNASVFEIRIDLETGTNVPLRSGYSSVAEIELDRRENVMVEERRRELAVRMALGARPATILWDRLCEGILITCAGGVTGVLASAAIVKGMNLLPIDTEVRNYLGYPELSLTTALIITLLLGIAGCLAGYWPARKAAAINPVNALHE